MKTQEHNQEVSIVEDNMDKASRKIHQPDNKLQMLAIAAILLLCALFMFYKAGDSFRGFHSFNEAFYANTAADYAEMPLYQVITKPIDFNNPPFYMILLVLVFKIFGVSAFAARSLSIAFSLATVYFIYKLGKHFHSGKTGLMAALLLVLDPAFLLVGRNVQLESLLIALLTSALYLYLLSIEKDSVGIAVLAGFLLGLGLLTKLPAILLLAAIIIWHLVSKQKQLLFSKRFYLFIATTLVSGGSWYAYQAISSPATFFGSQTYLAGTLRSPDLYFYKSLFFVELFWGLSPVIFLVSIGAVFYIAWTALKARFAGFDGLIIITLALFVIFYMFYHFHTYYLAPIVPLLMLLTGQMLSERIKNVNLFAVCAVCLAVLSSFFSFAMLGAHKYGFGEYEQVAEIVNRAESKKVVLEVPSSTYENYGPVLSYLMPDVSIRSDKSPEDFPKDSEVFWWISPKAYSYEYVKRPGVWMCDSGQYSPAIFGYRSAVDFTMAIHRFDMGQINLEKAPDCLFGMSEIQYPGCILINWSENGTPSPSEISW